MFQFSQTLPTFYKDYIPHWQDLRRRQGKRSRSFESIDLSKSASLLSAAPNIWKYNLKQGQEVTTINLSVIDDLTCKMTYKLSINPQNSHASQWQRKTWWNMALMFMNGRECILYLFWLRRESNSPCFNINVYRNNVLFKMKNVSESFILNWMLAVCIGILCSCVNFPEDAVHICITFTNWRQR